MSVQVANRTTERTRDSQPPSLTSERPVASEPMSPHGGLMYMQRAAGNQAVNRIIQAKLKVSSPGDRYEREADAVADQVMRMMHPGVMSISRFASGGSISTQPVQRACSHCEDPAQRKPVCDDCEAEAQRSAQTESIQMSAAATVSPAVSSTLGADINAARSNGFPLTVGARSFFEPRFGFDFSGVRIHTGSQAASLTQSVNARAFTTGRDIFFGRDQFSPETASGRRLLAHELTHVVQQSTAPQITDNHDKSDEGSTQTGPVVHRFAGGGTDVIVQRQFGLLPGPEALLGKTWLALPKSIKAKLVDKAIAANIKAVDKFPGAFVFGVIWPLIKAGLSGFWEKLKGAEQEQKLKATDTMARIMAGESSEYSLAMLKGLAKGFFIEGAAGIFIAAWDLLKGLKGVWDFLWNIGNAIGGFPDDIKQIIKNFEAFSADLLINIGPAVDEFLAEASDPKKVTAFLSAVSEKAKSFAKEAGEKIADTLLNLFTKKGGEAEIGETVGSVVGQVLWEVVFAIVTAGAGTAVTAGKVALKEATRVIAKVVGKVVGSILKLVEEIRLVFGKVVEVVKKAVSFVKGKLAAIGTKLGELLESVGKLLKRLLDNCHESKIKCKLGRGAKQMAEEAESSEQLPGRLKTRAKATEASSQPKGSGGKGRKADIKELDDVAKQYKMNQEQRRDFGDFIEQEKASGNRGTKNDRGDFTRRELQQKAREFLGSESEG